MATRATLEEILNLTKQLSLVDKVRLLEEIAPQIEREVMQRPSAPRKSLRGLWKGIDVTEEDLAQIRDEMWGRFPRYA